MKSYMLYIAKPLLVFYLLMFAALVLSGVLAVTAAALGGFGPESPPWEVLVIWPGVAVFVAYMWLRIPFEIKIRDDNTVEFRSLLRRTTVSPGEIISVKAKPYALGFIDVQHSKGTIHLVSQMNGFHDFISTLKSLNPAIEVKGC